MKVIAKATPLSELIDAGPFALQSIEPYVPEHAVDALRHHESLSGLYYIMHDLVAAWHLPLTWDGTWECGDRIIRGGLPKRISAWAKYFEGITIDDDSLSRLGEYMHRSLITNATIDITSTLQWRQGEFGDDGSCYWTSMRVSRWLLQRANALALRVFREREGELAGVGRAWLLQEPDDTLVLMNGYGRPLESMAGWLSTVTGLNVKQVYLSCGGSANYPIYINQGKGYLLSKVQIEYKERYNIQSVATEVCCVNCDCLIYDPEGVHYRSGGVEPYCRVCIGKARDIDRECHECGQRFEIETEGHMVRVPDWHLVPLCLDCMRAWAVWQCPHCLFFRAGGLACRCGEGEE